MNLESTKTFLKPVEKNQKKCKNGHTYFKSSSCPICPICEKRRVSTVPFLNLFPAPARRALEKAGITTIVSLKAQTPEALLKLHGFGPSSLKIVMKLVKTN